MISFVYTGIKVSISPFNSRIFIKIKIFVKTIQPEKNERKSLEVLLHKNNPMPIDKEIIADRNTNIKIFKGFSEPTKNADAISPKIVIIPIVASIEAMI